MSPDEVCLVDGARQLGYVFRGATTKGKILEINREDKRERSVIEVLQYFEFTSDRKRSSIIFRHDNVIKFMIKGADNVVMNRLIDDEDQ